jgi:hypothetical protein
MVLEFINELMFPDASLPKDTYKAKKVHEGFGPWVREDISLSQMLYASLEEKCKFGQMYIMQ